MNLAILLVSALARARAHVKQDPSNQPQCASKILQNACLVGDTYRRAPANSTAAGCCAACAADGAKCVAWTIDTDRRVKSWSVFDFNMAPCHLRALLLHVVALHEVCVCVCVCFEAEVKAHDRFVRPVC